MVEPPSKDLAETEADDLVAFFRALPADARRDYEALAELDRLFGEDVEAEGRAEEKAKRS